MSKLDGIKCPSDEMQHLDLYPEMAGLLYSLPYIGDPWPKAKRNLWIDAFNAVCDMLYPEPEVKNETADPVSVPKVATPTPKPKINPAVGATGLPEVNAETSDGKKWGPVPYRGSKSAAKIIYRMIRSIGNDGYLWINEIGRLKIAGAEYTPGLSDKLVGVYTKTVTVAAIAADLSAVGVTP